MMIGGLAEAGGVGVETIRYYQRRGLLRTPPLGGATRRYDASDVRRLCFIRQAQTAGFTLNQIAELLTLDAGTDRTRARAMARDRIADLEHQIAELETAKAALERLAAACAHDDGGPCPIISTFAMNRLE
jgi:MerR family mercuric resistance operon transcriptional regulator